MNSYTYAQRFVSMVISESYQNDKTNHHVLMELLRQLRLQTQALTTSEVTWGFSCAYLGARNFIAQCFLLMLDLRFRVWICHLSSVVPSLEEEEPLNIFLCLYFIIILKRAVEARHCQIRVREWSCVNSDCLRGNSKRTGLSSLSTKLFLDCSLVSLPSVLSRSGFPADYLSA